MEGTTSPDMKRDIENDSGAPIQNIPPKTSKRSRFAHLVAFCVSIFFTFVVIQGVSPFGDISVFRQNSLVPEAVCPKTTPIAPLTHSALLEDLEAEYATHDFQMHAYNTLSGAVRIPYVKLPC